MNINNLYFSYIPYVRGKSIISYFNIPIWIYNSPSYNTSSRDSLREYVRAATGTGGPWAWATVELSGNVFRLYRPPW